MTVTIHSDVGTGTSGSGTSGSGTSGSGTSAVPRVSVLITTYNASRFVEDTIHSVLGQTFGDFELVVVDDGSSDDTLDILARCDDPRLRIMRAPQNLGVVGARNYGFRQLRGAYVATLDHDDYWLPTRLEAGVALLDADSELVFVGTRHDFLLHGQHMPADRPCADTPALMRWMLLMDCQMVYSSLLFRRAVAALPGGGFLRADVRYADDYELMLRFAFNGKGVQIEAPLTVYRFHDSNTTHVVGAEMERNAIKILTDIYARWLGGDATAAAACIARHIARRQPAASLAELDQVGRVISRLLDGFFATYPTTADEHRRIVGNARAAYWRPVRASVRGGRIWLIGCYLWHRSLSVLGAFPVDVGLSLAAGLVTLLFRRGRMRVGLSQD